MKKKPKPSRDPGPNTPAPKTSGYAAIYAVVKRIPAGKVATYGQIATLAKLPGRARFVGYALHALPAGSNVPWHRVVNAQGRLSLGAISPAGALEQQMGLAREGVTVVGDRVPLRLFLWKPR